MCPKPQSSQLALSKAVDGFLLARSAAGYSPHTLSDYRNTLQQFIAFVGDRPIQEITADDVRAFLAHLRALGRAPKTIRNAYVGLSSLWTWLSAEFDMPHIVRRVSSPKAPEPLIQPFSREEVERLIEACKYSREAAPRDRRSFRMRRPTARRDLAIILVLLDTGIRASELCQLAMGDVDLQSGQVVVRKGKGGRGRVVYLGRSARKALWCYLVERGDLNGDDPLFAARDNRPFTRDTLGRLLARIGERAGVVPCRPHRFRHTFAIEYLRNGGDVFTLQKLLGHRTLEMVRRYLAIVRTDLERVHRTASPVDRWRL